MIPEPIEALIFDLDDTLVDERYWIEKRWLETIDFVEKDLMIDGFGDSFWEVYMQRGRKYKNHVNDALKKCNRDEQLLKEIVTFFHSQIILEKPFPGVIDFLKFAEKRFKLGIVTNGRMGVQLERINRLGITNYFSSIVCAFELPKPNPQPYLTSMQELDSEPGKSFYVSHDQDDFNGAKVAGMKTIHINLLSETGMQNVDIEVSNYMEFLEIIRS